MCWTKVQGCSPPGLQREGSPPGEGEGDVLRLDRGPIQTYIFSLIERLYRLNGNGLTTLSTRIDGSAKPSGWPRFFFRSSRRSSEQSQRFPWSEACNGWGAF